MILRTLAIAAAALVTLAAPVTAQTVGTAAAVNPAALGTPPGGAPPPNTQGANQVQNHRIATNDGGLVQVLFADGTTLTVGPRSELVIDSFFYDPAAGNAQLNATMTTGVLRFIGGLTSKSPQGAQISTPVGTVGIRGGIADIVMSPPSGIPRHISMIFGTEVTLQQGGQLLERLYQSGYSIVFGGGNITIQKTPPEWSSDVQQALAGRPGTSGGSPNQPTDQQVADSGVPQNNSRGLAGSIVPLPPLTREEIDQLLVAVAAYDELRQFIIDNGGGDPPPPPPSPDPITGPSGASAGVVHILNYDSLDQLTMDRWAGAVTTGDPISAALTVVQFDDNGAPEAAILDVITATSSCIACRLQFTMNTDGTVTAAATDQYGLYNALSATGSIQGQADVTLPNGIVPCACEFMHWGTWNGSASFADATTGGTIDISIENGTYAVADSLTTLGELDTLGMQELSGWYATYEGHAVGSIQMGSASPELAAGNMSMQWSFANRDGHLSIYDFGSDPGNLKSFTGYMESPPGTLYFGGTLDDYAYGYGYARGGFANDGSTPAAGVLGDFVMEGYDYLASGVFLGDRGPDGNNY